MLEKENLAGTLKSILVKYVYYQNKKHQREKLLFKSRFYSKCIESDEYLLQVLAYVHQNPLKAGLVDSMADYPHSIYKAYLGYSPFDLTDIYFIHEVLGSKEKYIKFMSKESNLNIEHKEEERKRPLDYELEEFVQKNYKGFYLIS